MNEKKLKKHTVRALEFWYGMTPCKKDMLIKACYLNDKGFGHYYVKIRHIDYKIHIIEDTVVHDLYYVERID